MGTTNNGLHYPEAGDLVRDYPAVQRASQKAIDARISELDEGLQPVRAATDAREGGTLVKRRRDGGSNHQSLWVAEVPKNTGSVTHKGYVDDADAATLAAAKDHANDLPAAALATSNEAGLMPATDKAKLNAYPASPDDLAGEDGPGAVEALMLATALKRAGSNLLANGDFENTSPDIWPNNSYQDAITVIDSPLARSGTRVLEQGSATSNRYPMTDPMEVTEGRTYLMELWVYRQAEASTARIAFYTRSTLTDGTNPGDYGETMDGASRIYFFPDEGDVPVGEWTRLQAYYHAPEGALLAEFGPHTRPVDPPYLFDDMRIIDVTEGVEALHAAQANADELAAVKALTDTATNLATGDTLMRRNANGQTSVSDPTHANHATNKGYVDGLIDSIGGGGWTDGTPGTDVTAGTNRYVRIRDNLDGTATIALNVLSQSWTDMDAGTLRTLATFPRGAANLPADSYAPLAIRAFDLDYAAVDEVLSVAISRPLNGSSPIEIRLLQPPSRVFMNAPMVGILTVPTT